VQCLGRAQFVTCILFARDCISSSRLRSPPKPALCTKGSMRPRCSNKPHPSRGVELEARVQARTAAQLHLQYNYVKVQSVYE